MERQLLNTARQSDLIYDFGLHRGEDTDFYLKKGFRVIAFEANPELVNACRIRFAEAVSQQRLIIIEGAIVDPDSADARRGSVSFYRNDERSIWGTTNAAWAERNASLGYDSTVIEVKVIDLKRVIQQYGVPYYMKIDIEGCDLICLRMLENFRTRPAYVSLESDKTDFDGITREISLLLQLGYDRFQVIEQSSIADVQTPPLPACEGTYADHRFEHGSSGLFGSELPGAWLPARKVRNRYVIIRLGYYLLGDAGLMTRWTFPGAKVLRGTTRRAIRLFTRAPVPGWYDTHARIADMRAPPT